MWRRILPAVGLFFLSPLVAEFLLGNISISAITAVLFLAPMYGGGAILVREVARRTGRGWPTIIVLALAYAVIEEGLVTQTLFNPSYFGLDLLAPAHISALGIGGWWTLFVLTLHTVWSIAVPIALIEALVPARRTEPWLGKVGTTVTSVLFVLGAIANCFGTYASEHFIASVPQLVVTAIIVVALVILAFVVKGMARADGVAPSPWLVGAGSLVASSAFMMTRWALEGWAAVAVYLILYTVVTVVVVRWSARDTWGDLHRTALAGGALLTYAWNAFPQHPVIGDKGAVDLFGNGVFAVGALVLLFFAVRKNTRYRSLTPAAA